jgi:mono/diheme cytochrome c family protein
MILSALLAGLLSAASPMCAQDKGDAKGDPDKGNEIFDEHCSSCHNAYSYERKKGPALKGLFAKGKLESNGKPANEPNIREKIAAGGNGMPAFKGSFSAADEADLIAYLKTL